jgi:hypothetical protein
MVLITGGGAPRARGPGPVCAAGVPSNQQRLEAGDRGPAQLTSKHSAGLGCWDRTFLSVERTPGWPWLGRHLGGKGEALAVRGGSCAPGAISGAPMPPPAEEVTSMTPQGAVDEGCGHPEPGPESAH